MKIKLTTLAILTTLSYGAQADIDWSGFATLTGGKAFGEDAATTGIDGFSDSISFKDGSFVALQATKDIGEGLGATVQIMSRGADDWDVDVSWAFLSYDVSDEWRVIVGRQRMPHYTYSDYLDVSYAYNWVTVPSEIYNAPFSSFDGISSQYTFDFGSSSLFTQVLSGKESDDDSTRSYDDIIGGKLTYNYDWLTINVAYFEFEETAIDEDDDSISSIGVLKSTDIGIQVDYNDWLVVAEVSSVDFGDVKTGDNLDEEAGRGIFQPWMLSVAKRIGDFTPHITHGESRTLDALSRQTGLEEDTATPFTTVGVRWDFHPAAALKAEYSKSEDGRFGTGESFQIALVTVF